MLRPKLWGLAISMAVALAVGVAVTSYWCWPFTVALDPGSGDIEALLQRRGDPIESVSEDFDIARIEPNFGEDPEVSWLFRSENGQIYHLKVSSSRFVGLEDEEKEDE